MAIVLALVIVTNITIMTILAIKTRYQLQGIRSRVGFLAPVIEVEVVETVTSLLRCFS